jgi:hypothetical protein
MEYVLYLKMFPLCNSRRNPFLPLYWIHRKNTIVQTFNRRLDHLLIPTQKTSTFPGKFTTNGECQSDIFHSLHECMGGASIYIVFPYVVDVTWRASSLLSTSLPLFHSYLVPMSVLNVNPRPCPSPSSLRSPSYHILSQAGVLRQPFLNTHSAADIYWAPLVCTKLSDSGIPILLTASATNSSVQ